MPHPPLLRTAIIAVEALPDVVTMAPPPNLTSLLNSLHTHLQTQTQLLPTLHHQLGLAENALEEELTKLQAQLLAQVEELVHSRQKEVEDWVDRCEQVEDACIRYSKALGGNVKATGSCVGEIRKEKIYRVKRKSLDRW